MSFPQANDDEVYVISHFYIPLYSPGVLPTTLQERRARHTGFVSVVSFAPAAEYVEFLPESYQGLDTVFFPETEVFADTRPDIDLIREVGPGGFAHETFTANGMTTHLYTRASWTLRRAMQTSDRWWALSIGLLTTTWLCSLMLLLRRHTGAMTALVDQRTQALADRTHKLSEVNAALMESEARYRMLADNVSDVIFTNDVNGICTYISPSITLQNGFSVEDYVGKPFYVHSTPKSVEAIKKGLELARENPNSLDFNQRFELETFCKDGTVKSLECSLSMLTGSDGSYQGILGVSRDITDRKQAEQHRLALEAAFRQSQKMDAIGTLAGGVAHDFNNLLTGILGHAELVKSNEKLDRDIQGSLNVIETAALRAKELTSQLLGFARKGRLQTTEVRINDLVKETMALLDRTIDKGIRIHSTLDKQPLIINADPGQITQILLNLAVNARDAMPDGGRLLFETRRVLVDEYFSFTHYEPLKPGPYCIISVTDTGTGIAKDKLSRIFEPFFTDKPDGKGTGLGLAMVYGVTKSHGGTVTVYSEVGIGTVFKVYLPLSPTEIEESIAKPPQAPISGKGTILVVDDEAIVRNLAEAMLQKLGYNVLLASDGASAIDFYTDNWQTIDLVILDMIMPNMGGRECLEHMQSLNPSLKAIISTGYSHDTIANRMSDHHSYGFLQKPYRLQELSEIVANTISA
ncbi:MAG: ATP-binding protein, partial [Pseudomonadota bacterium]